MGGTAELLPPWRQAGLRPGALVTRHTRSPRAASPHPPGGRGDPARPWRPDALVAPQSRSCPPCSLRPSVSLSIHPVRLSCCHHAALTSPFLGSSTRCPSVRPDSVHLPAHHSSPAARCPSVHPPPTHPPIHTDPHPACPPLHASVCPSCHPGELSPVRPSFPAQAQPCTRPSVRPSAH